MNPPLRDSQSKALEIGRTEPKFGYYFDTGCGKTRTAMAIIANDMWAGGGSWLVVTPRSVIPGWIRECRLWMLPAWSPTPVMLTRAGLRAQGWGAKKEQFKKEMEAASETITIVNPESLQLVIGARHYEGLVVDESSIMAGMPTSKRNPKTGKSRVQPAMVTQRLLALGSNADRVYLLSGNPSPNGPLYLWSQAVILGLFSGSWFAWANRYGYQDKFRSWHLRKGCDQEILDLMATRTWYLDKKDVLDLPECQTIPREFVAPEGGPTWSALLAAVKEEGLGCVMRWRTEASGFMYIKDEDAKRSACVGHTARLEALADLLDELGTRRVIIWHQFEQSRDQIEELIARRGGLVTSDPELYMVGVYQYLLAHPRSIGKGTDGLQHCAADMVFYEISYSYDEFYQCLSRLHRSGQTLPVSVYVLLAMDTIDEEAWKAIQKKEDLAEQLRRALGRAE